MLFVSEEVTALIMLILLVRVTRMGKLYERDKQKYDS